jgi:hypothetical protein
MPAALRTPATPSWLIRCDGPERHCLSAQSDHFADRLLLGLAAAAPVSLNSVTPSQPPSRLDRPPNGLTIASIHRSCMLMPLLVRLTDSEIEAINLVVSQGLHAIEDRSGAIEEVGSPGPAIHEELSFPDLHVEPVHRDAQLGGQFGSGQYACVMRPTGALHRLPSPSDWRCRMLSLRHLT